MKYGFILKEQDKFPVTVLCRLMKVRRSSYYDWKKHRSCRVYNKNELDIRREMKRLFRGTRQAIGSRRMAKMLTRLGFEIGRYKTRRLMKEMNLIAKLKRKYKAITNSSHKLPVADNILDRSFCPAKPNLAWVSDIKYVWTSQGWLCLAVIIDMYSKKIIGWCTDKRMTKYIVISSLLMAVGIRNSKPGLIIHSDRGSQYVSHDYQRLLKQFGMIPSMSRKGNCWDNAPTESFFGSLKQEWIGDNYYLT